MLILSYTMQDDDYNNFAQNKIASTSITQKKIEKVLKLLINSCDIHIITKVFSTIGIYLLSSETSYESIMKCDPLYDKIALVLNNGSQAKTTIALNFICALLYLNEDGQTKKKSLHIYVQNMIRISGCLTAMTNLFIGFMLHQDTFMALCRSISEACRGSTSNQTYCSHLVPLCIRRCRGRSPDVFIVLQSLLPSHRGNIRLFYDSDGMTLFTREALQNAFCLQLLNTVVENTTDDYKNELLKSSHLFEHLRYLLHRYGASNSISEWISIVLFSYQKVFSINDGIKNFEIKEKEANNYSRKVFSNKKLNETDELFQNILKEVIGLQSAEYKNTRQKSYNKNITGNGHHNINVAKKNLKDSLSKPVATVDNDLTFSFLSKAHPIHNDFKDKRQTIKYDRNVSTRIHSNKSSNVFSNNQNARNLTQNFGKKSIATLTQEDDEDNTFHFLPPFVSTPKSSKNTLRTSFISQLSRRSFLRSISKRKCDIKTNKINKNIIRKMSENKTVQNKTIGAKFIDIINGSCTTLVKSFTSFRNIFKKERLTCKDKSVVTSCTDKIKFNLTSNSFTNYMQNRDVLSYYFNKRDETLTNEFSIKDNFRSCDTCNDTISLKRKLTNDATLQQTVKRLKFGINLYGCDFKKISRTMWPNEDYMTPSVLYNLYRKLIIK